MGYYSYKIEHDFGLAPNPFGGYCTLAVCKGRIRNNKNLQLGNWIFGTGSAKLKNLHHLVFMMQVEEKLSFQQYWADDRFQYKKPVINGSLVQMYGDNIYHKDHDTDEWIQENSAHSLDGGIINESHLETDLKGNNVLISRTFYYFGDQNIKIPHEYLQICCEGRDMKSNAIPKDVADEFVNWVQANYEMGIHGDPINWKNHR